MIPITEAETKAVRRITRTYLAHGWELTRTKFVAALVEEGLLPLRAAQVELECYIHVDGVSE